MELFNQLITFLKANQMIAGAVSFWALGVAGVFFKTVPLSILAFTKKQMTTTVAISNYDLAYYNFLDWFEKNKYKKYSRMLKLTNGRWGHEAQTNMSAGSGIHFFVEKGTLFFFRITQADSSHTEKDKETLHIAFFGRNSQKMTDFIHSIMPAVNDNTTTKIHTYHHHGAWVELTSEAKRRMNSVFINKDTKSKLLGHIDRFFASKEWYIKNGIPYRTCILLHGPPGTGKTSIVKALAAHYNKSIHILDVDKVAATSMRDAMCRVPNTSIIAIEDIDSLSSIQTREKSKKPEGDLEKALNGGGISTVLNAFDGIGTFSDKVVIMTTNHMDKLDPAMLRPGRIDLILEISELDSDSIKEYLQTYYEEETTVDLDFEPIKGCELQKLVLDSNGQFQNVIENLKKVVV